MLYGQSSKSYNGIIRTGALQNLLQMEDSGIFPQFPGLLSCP